MSSSLRLLGQPVQRLADNGSAYTAGETIDLAVSLNLVACFMARIVALNVAPRAVLR
jgi:hypothetical protein